MFVQQPAPWISKKHLIGAGVVTLVLTITLGIQAQPRVYEKTFAGVPIPFLPADESLAASVEFYDTRNGIDIYEVRFEHGELAEWLSIDRIYLVRVPDSDLVAEVPLDQIMLGLSGVIGDVDYFGYKYVTADAVFEITARFAEAFRDRFPGYFFASDIARVRAIERGESIEAFETLNQVVMHKTDGSFSNADMRRNSLWVFAVNEPGGARLAPLGSPLCGNGEIDTGEECDDGILNGTDGSTCNAQCLYKIPIPPLPGGSSSSSQGGFSSDSSSSSSDASSGNSSSSSSSSDDGSGSSTSSSTSSSSSSQSGGSGSSESSSSSSSSTGGGSGSSTSSSSSSSSSSSLTQCGGVQGLECTTGERCEDDPTDTCDPNISPDCGGYCVPDTCGDAVHQEPEQCDDGNSNHFDSCNNYCQLLTNPF